MDQTDTIGIGKADAAEAAHNTPDQTKPSLLDIFLSRLKSAFIINTIISLFSIASIPIISPVLIISLYSIANGLPFFEIFSIISENAHSIFIISLILLFSMSILFISPGIIILFGRKSGKSSRIEDKNDKIISPSESLIWIKSYIPGLILAQITIFLFYLFELNNEIDFYKSESFIFITSITLSVILIISLKYILTIIKISKENKLNIRNDISPSVNFKILILANFCGFLYSIYLITISMKALTKGYIFQELIKIEFKYSSTITPIACGLFSGCYIFTLYTISTIWSLRISFLKILYAITLPPIFFLFIWPNGNEIMKLSLRLLSQGGGIPVVMTTDPSLAREWPELFQAAQSTDGSEAVARTKEISLVLMGKDKVFVHLPPPTNDQSAGATLMIDRSRLKDIAFLDPKKQTPKPAGE